jgi:hypothetical protein
MQVRPQNEIIDCIWHPLDAVQQSEHQRSDVAHRSSISTTLIRA